MLKYSFERNKLLFMKKHKISRVLPDSIGEELGLEAGDFILKINDNEIEDIFDYDFFCAAEHLDLLAEGKDGEQVVFEIDKDEDEDLGLCFESGLMDDYKSCRNKCVFCFIDQMPPGMRPTLYFKDDDSRLSFLQGNYVTLTNMDDHDIDRIIRYRLEPINISVQAMDPALRCRMLNNRFAGEALKKMDKLYQAGITMNGQIVLCPDWNDGEQLRFSLEALKKYLPVMQSVSVVPVGLTKYREGLPKLRPFTPGEAAAVIDLIEAFQREAFAEHGLYFVHASDEFYLLAGRPLPEEARYDGYLQLENGVGMLRLFADEFDAALKKSGRNAKARHVTVATGMLAAPLLKEKAALLMQKYPSVKVSVIPVRNDFFGEGVTVSGLVTGQDLIAQLKGQDLGEALYIPDTMLRSGEEVFLDDLTLNDVESALSVPVMPLPTDGGTFVKAVLGREKKIRDPRFRPYELKEE